MPPDTGTADLAACRALLADGSKSFALASRLLPRRVREPASALYAFCRVADDAVDGESAQHWTPSRACAAGCATRPPLDGPADRALAGVVGRPTFRAPFWTRCSKASRGTPRVAATRRSTISRPTRRAWPARWAR